MKEKGLATAAIVFFVVVIIVVAALACLLTKPGAEGEETGPGGLPLYPGATSSSMNPENLLTVIGKELPSGVEASVYTTTASENDVLSWYRTEMPGKGWVEENDDAAAYDSVTYGLLYYEKGDNGAIIIAMQYMGTTVLILEHGPKTAFVGEENAEPGTDLANVPRYTGSTMTSYENAAGVVRINYSTTISISDVLSWYQTELVKTEYGWTYLYSYTDGACYSKTGVDLTVEGTADGYRVVYSPT